MVPRGARRTVLLLSRGPGPSTSLGSMLLRHLPEHGFRPVIASAQPVPPLATPEGEAVAVRVLPGLADVRTLAGALRLPAALGAVRRLAIEHDACLIHSLHGSTTPAALLASRLTGRPHLCHMQFLYASPRKYRKLWLHRATDVVAVSRAVLDAYRAACGARRPSRTHVIPYAVDAGAFLARAHEIDVRGALGIPGDAVAIVMVGSLDARKDPQTLLRAVGRLPAALARRIHLVFVGPFRTDRYRAETLALAGATPAAGCHFVGRRASPSPFFRGADIFVLPTRGDAFGIVFLEAMAHGTPVVASAVGGVPEVVEDGVTGVLAPPGDPDAFAEAIGRLAGDPALRRRLGEAGRRRLAERFSIPRAMEGMAAAYAACLAGGR